jgi:hypothetical protein
MIIKKKSRFNASLGRGTKNMAELLVLNLISISVVEKGINNLYIFEIYK